MKDKDRAFHLHSPGCSCWTANRHTVQFKLWKMPSGPVAKSKDFEPYLSLLSKKHPILWVTNGALCWDIPIIRTGPQYTADYLSFIKLPWSKQRLQHQRWSFIVPLKRIDSRMLANEMAITALIFSSCSPFSSCVPVHRAPKETSKVAGNCEHEATRQDSKWFRLLSCDQYKANVQQSTKDLNFTHRSATVLLHIRCFASSMALNQFDFWQLFLILA